MSTNNTERVVLQDLDSLKANSQRLMSEGLKVDALLHMMNNCADTCNLAYHETGLTYKKVRGVECYKNCITKQYKLAHFTE